MPLWALNFNSGEEFWDPLQEMYLTIILLTRKEGDNPNFHQSLAKDYVCMLLFEDRTRVMIIR